MTRTVEHMHRHSLVPPSLIQSHRSDGSQGAHAGTATQFGSGQHEFRTRPESRYCWGGRLINMRVRERSMYRLSIRTWMLVVPPIQIPLLHSYQLQRHKRLMPSAIETKIPQKYHHTEYIKYHHTEYIKYHHTEYIKYHHTEYIKRITPLFFPLFNTNCDELTYYGLPVATFSTDRTKGLQTILINVTKDHTKTEGKQEKHDIRYDIIGKLNFASPVLYMWFSIKSHATQRNKINLNSTLLT